MALAPDICQTACPLMFCCDSYAYLQVPPSKWARSTTVHTHAFSVVSGRLPRTPLAFNRLCKTELEGHFIKVIMDWFRKILNKENGTVVKEAVSFFD